jgi:hypothetical protein
VVPCGCENCSLTLREEHRIRVSVNRVLRRIFGLKRVEVTGLRKVIGGDVQLVESRYSSGTGIVRELTGRRTSAVGSRYQKSGEDRD